jgi:hypothetical protein
VIGERFGGLVEELPRLQGVHVKAPNARPISDAAAALAASTLAADSVGWRMFQWLQRSLVPDRAVVD